MSSYTILILNMSVSSGYFDSEYKIETDVFEFSEVDVAGCMSMAENSLRTLLTQCPCCNMFKLPDNVYSYLNEQYLNGFPPVSMTTCKNCIIIAEQTEAIDYLNDQIHDLVVTVDKLRNIREIENEIEMSFNCLNPPHKHEYREVREQDLSTNDEHEPIEDSSLQTNSTSDLKNNTKLDMDNEIEGILQQFSKLNVTECTNVKQNTNHQDNTPSDEKSV